MDTMAVENAGPVEDSHRADDGVQDNTGRKLEARSEPDNKFQQAIAAWRGTATSSANHLETRL